jgi:hypothetical protein
MLVLGDKIPLWRCVPWARGVYIRLFLLGNSEKSPPPQFGNRNQEQWGSEPNGEEVEYTPAQLALGKRWCPRATRADSYLSTIFDSCL